MSVAAPADLATAFAAAWNAHNAAGLAALFTADADFVNVVGMWWTGRETIEQAHAFAHRTFFRASELAIDATKERAIAPGIATVHARWTLTGQEELDGTTGRPRSGILLFLAQHEPGGWRVCAAQNTDVVPDALTVAAAPACPPGSMPDLVKVSG